MTEVSLDYDQKLRELVSKWEDSLESNHDDYVVVDNEEGDFGIVRYFGTDIDGVENVHLMTKYVHGGDSEESFYTPAGADVVQKIMRDNFETCLRKSLEDNLDPGSRDGMYIGFIADTEKASEIAQREGRSYQGQLHNYAELFPAEVKDGGVYKFRFKFYIAKVSRAEGDEQAPIMYFYNIINPAERLAIKIADDNSHQFFADHDTWRTGFGDKKIRAVTLGSDMADVCNPDFTPTTMHV